VVAIAALLSDRFAVCARAHLRHTGAYTWALGVPHLFMKIPRSKLRGIFVGEEIYYNSGVHTSAWTPLSNQRSDAAHYQARCQARCVTG